MGYEDMTEEQKANLETRNAQAKAESCELADAELDTISAGVKLRNIRPGRVRTNDPVDDDDED